MKEPELILFARQPVAGEAKTRLAAHCGAVRAAEIAAFLIRATVALAARHWPGRLALYASPNGDHPLFRELAESGLRVESQAEGDLGMKMHSALADGIARQGAAAVMGCDVPHCPPDLLRTAHSLLVRGGSVLGPAADGGYYLIGIQQPCKVLFEEMPWGSEVVRELTLARARACGIEFELLPVLRDIDNRDDLTAAVPQVPGLSAYL
ncbi:MAG: TIGR04282 family arsenosugar biosynthesis glycosyltransferase [Gammaproteobacteria bacterium]|nr:TIGR04282 family arsenosugar biosynthesis glycosyltransferase [Gammaproteobacteria bacterium]